MNNAEIADYLERAGWSVHREDVDDYYAEYELPDRCAVIHFGRSNGQKEFVWSVARKDFSSTWSAVDELPYGPMPLASMRVDRQAADLAAMIQLGFSWVTAQNPDKMIEELAEHAPERPGLSVLLYISALAMRGETARLQAYKNQAAKSGHSGLLFYLEAGHIDRALEIAKQCPSTS